MENFLNKFNALQKKYKKSYSLGYRLEKAEYEHDPEIRLEIAKKIKDGTELVAEYYTNSTDSKEIEKLFKNATLYLENN